MESKRKSKTVFILGAGFSVEAGAPTQEKIISEALGFYKENKQSFHVKKFSVFRKFLKNQLNVSGKERESVQLEDIFTPLDRCLSDNAQYRGISLDRIMNVREAIFHVIARTIYLKLSSAHNKKGYIDQFANHLICKPFDT